MTGGVGVLLAAVLMAAGPLGHRPAPSATARMSARQIVAAARTAALRRGTARIVMLTTSQGHTIVFDNQSARRGGRQLIVQDGSAAQIVLIDQVAFLRAGAAALASSFGLSTTQAAAGANRWIAVTPNDPQYPSVSAGISLRSTLGELLPGGRLTKRGTATVSGREVVVVGGVVAGAPTLLYVAAHGAPLPLREVSVGRVATETVVLSGWGRTVHLSPPAGAVPLDSLGS